MGIALAYAIAPLVLTRLLKLVEYRVFSIQYSVLAGLILAIQVMFDVRVSFLTTLVAIGYLVFHNFFVSRIKFKPLAISYSLLALVTILLHAFWILPSVLVALKGGNVANIVDTSSASLEFLSFAKFENSFSLLHPNWPENIFGKVGFMKPEFLLIPILAFGSLLFVKSSKYENQDSKKILFFALVGLAGVFLAKGTQEPFGEVFRSLYSSVPGFNFFRDPIKFYILIAISYSMLIPYLIRSISKKHIAKFFAYLFIIFWLALNVPLITNQIGLFKERKIPEDYVKLNKYLLSDKEFSRTLWIPSYQRFGHISNDHPVLSGQDLLGNLTKQIDILKSEHSISLMKSAGIRYVIIPYDSEDEIFLSDRKYDSSKYQKAISEIQKLKDLKEIDCCARIKVYEITDSWGKFVIKNLEEPPGQNLSYQMVSPTKYVVPVDNIQAWDRLFFSENYDEGWEALIDGEKIKSDSYGISEIGYFNSFVLPRSGSFNVEISYGPQKWTNFGYIISVMTLITVLWIICTWRGKTRKRAQVS